MRKNILISLMVASSIGVGAYWYWSPNVALYEMQRAARDADPDEFSDHVDYPKLRESVKGQLSARFTQQAPGSGTAAMLGLALVDRMADALIRPETVMHAVQNGKLKFAEETRGADEQRITIAEADVSLLKQTLMLYKLDHGTYPTQGQGLKILVDPSGKPGAGKPYLKKIPLDPWGRQYEYRSPGAEPGTVDVTYLPPPMSSQSTRGGSDSPMWHTERTNVNTLTVYAGDAEKSMRERTGFVMAREGFAQWKLTEIRLPAVGK